MSNHTPGPWAVDAGSDCTGVYVSAKNGFTVHDQTYRDYVDKDLQPDFPDDDEVWANAHLIAAAPEMLEALKHMLLVCENYDFDGCDFEYWAGPDALPIVKAAIAKAEGQQ